MLEYNRKAPRPDRPKAEFKATRELVGYTTNDVAKAIGVQERAVLRWEAFHETHMAPLVAWQVLDDAMILQRQVVALAIARVEEMEERFEGELEPIELPYYSNDREYAEYASGSGDGSGFRRANATARAVYSALTGLGYRVEWISGSDAKVKNTILD